MGRFEVAWPRISVWKVDYRNIRTLSLYMAAGTKWRDEALYLFEPPFDVKVSRFEPW